MNYDLIVIGSGPGGYTAAIKATQLGMKVACIEKNTSLGGTCLNIGCIPSKALLHYSLQYEHANKYFSNIGIKGHFELDLATMISQKNKVVRELCIGIEMLFNKNKVTKIIGKASLVDNNTVLVEYEGNVKHITGKNILIATGSLPISISNISIDEKIIVSSTGALDLSSVPPKMIVIGGGYIGLELGSVWRRLGSEVTVIEASDSIIPLLDSDISKELLKILTAQGMKFLLNSKVLSVKQQNNSAIITIFDGNKEQILLSDVVLVSVGRMANSANLNLDKLDIKVDSKGCIIVNDKYQTKVSNIYAIGDVIKGPMLAHKASEEGIAAVENMMNLHGLVNYNTMPSVVYTSPEIATVGKNEQELIASGIEYKKGKFPFLANGKAKTIGEVEGFVKILADKKTNQILGAHIIGPEAGTMINEVTVAMEFYASTDDIGLICHPHPTLGEAIKEAALDVDRKAINF